MRLIVPAGASLALLLSCLPTDICGCSPIPPAVMVLTTVRDAAGGLVAGAVVTVKGTMSSAVDVCDPLVLGQPLAKSTTLADGTTRERISSSGDREHCIRVIAQMPPPSSLKPDTVARANVAFRSADPLDTVRVDLVLR